MHGFEREDDKATCHSTLTGWKESGKRITRGLYRSADGTKINADGNGAANIIRKVAIKLGLDLSRISSGELIAPLKIRLWVLQESPRMHGMGSIKKSTLRQGEKQK
ncbi:MULTISPECIES: hypothetical protein [unclassified Microcoleus]|uniref:hypothetical protein n=1 Tax=unclassified Microcoleus TaxID=2642155 RepID=UPI002FCEEDBC